MTTATLAILTAFAGPPGYARPQFADVEVVRDAGSTHVLAYDQDGEIAAEVSVRPDGDGPIRLDATFADGEYLRAVSDGDGLLEYDATENAELHIAALVEAMEAEDGNECLYAVSEMVGGCIAVHWFCPALMVFAGCACNPDFAEEHPSLCPG